MKKIVLSAVVFASIVLGVAFAGPIHDWKDLEKVHNHVQEAMKEMDKARAANHYDMDGHGAKAEQLLRDAEHELHDAVESAKKAH